MNKKRLKDYLVGKSVLITGASSGIGEQLAYRLANISCHLILTARKGDKLSKIKNEIEMKAAKVSIFQADLRNEDEMENFLTFLHELPNGLDIIVNNAGHSIKESLYDSLDRYHDFTRTMALNYFAPVQILLSTIPLLKRNHGQIINISTVNALLAPVPYFAAHHIAIVDDHETISYEQLLAQSNKLACCLKEDTQLHSGQKVGFLCKNHASLVKSIFACSRLGADLYLLNAEMSKRQFNAIVVRHHFDLLIYDAELSSVIEQSHYANGKILSYHHSLPAINNFLLSSINEKQQLRRTSAGKIVLQTSGITGVSKDVAHKPSLFNYLNPFVAFIKRLTKWPCTVHRTYSSHDF